MGKIYPKRGGFIWVAVTIAIGLIIVAGIVLGLTLFNGQSRIQRVASFLLEKWQITLTELVIWSSCVAGLAIYTIISAFGARKKDKTSAIVIILGHLIAFGFGIYITLELGSISSQPVMGPESLFIKTHFAIYSGRNEDSPPDLYFLPRWLDHIQKLSSKCCGIRSYHDWETFWAPLPGTYPKSCCIRTMEHCVNVAANITNPDVLENNIKTEEGCYKEIVAKVREIILQSQNFAAAFTVSIGISFAAVLALYTVVFFLKKPRRRKRRPVNRDTSVDDMDEYQRDVRNEVPPDFDPTDNEWRNLEFYTIQKMKDRVRSKKSKKSQRSNVSLSRPFRGNSSNFQQSSTTTEQTFQQKLQPQPEYRIDFPSIPQKPVQLQIFEVQPQQSLLPSSLKKKASGLSDINNENGQRIASCPPPNVDLDQYQDETLIRTSLRMQRKHRHRRRRVKDNQDNDIDLDPSKFF